MRGWAFRMAMCGAVAVWGACAAWGQREDVGRGRGRLAAAYPGQVEPTDERLPHVGDPVGRIRDVLRGHLSLGTRMTHYRLDKHRGHFLQNLNELDEKQYYAPEKAFVDWFFWRYVGIELTWDRFRVTGYSGDDHHADGDFVLYGPIAMVLGRWENETRFTPFAGLGLCRYEGYFDNELWWELGYSTKADWEANPNDRPNKTRHIELADTVGTVIMGGVDIGLWKGVAAELTIRYTDVEADAHHEYTEGGKRDDPIDVTIPFSHTTYALGLKYRF